MSMMKLVGLLLQRTQPLPLTLVTSLNLINVPQSQVALQSFNLCPFELNTEEQYPKDPKRNFSHLS